MKKLYRLLICVTVLIAISGFMFSAAADEDIYGTYDKGIEVPRYSFQRINPLPEFKNGDFSEGLKYWATVNGDRPSDVVKLIEQGNNTYIQLTGTGDYSGIVTPLFVCDRLTAGQMPVVIFDWRGSDEFQIYLSQWSDIGSGKQEFRIGLKGGEVIKEAVSENGWSTSITSLNQVLERSTDGNDNIYLSIGVQRFQNNTVTSYVDNLRLGIVDTETGELIDYDGNSICKLENFKVKKLSKTQERDGVTSVPEKLEEKEDKPQKTENKDNSSSNKPNNIQLGSETKIIITVISLAAVIVLSIIIFGIIYLKRLGKKTKG